LLLFVTIFEGIERATRWGDALAQLAYNFKLL
jgi:hypothetical protein